MTPEERITQHRRLAESYRNAYLREGVKDGEEYTDENGHDAWKFADGAIYTSPYFTGDETILMSEALVDTGRAATMEPRHIRSSSPNGSRPVSNTGPPTTELSGRPGGREPP